MSAHVEVRFDLIDQFDIAYCDVKGDLTLDRLPRPGETLAIAADNRSLTTCGLPIEQQVLEVREEGIGGRRKTVVRLSPACFSTVEELSSVSKMLEDELNFFCWVYRDADEAPEY